LVLCRKKKKICLYLNNIAYRSASCRSSEHVIGINNPHQQQILFLQEFNGEEIVSLAYTRI